MDDKATTTTEAKIPKKKRGKAANPLGSNRRYVTFRYRQNVALRKIRARQRKLQDGIGFLAEQVAVLPNGFKDFMPFVRVAALRDGRFKPVIETYDKLVGWQSGPIGANRLEEICLNLGVPVGELFGAAVGVAFDSNKDQTRLIASMAMPIVMKANIARAKTRDGVEDRRMFMQSTGLLPVPKGSTINVAAQANATVTNDGDPSGLPSFEDHVLEFSEVIRRATDTPRALPEPVDVISEDES